MNRPLALAQPPPTHLHRTGRHLLDPAVVRRTQVVDLARAIPLGFILPLETSLVLTIAIRQFDAPAMAKGLIAAAGGVGLLTSTLLTAGARRSTRPAMSIASQVVSVGAAGFLIASTGSLVLFVVGVVIGLASVNMNVPLVTAVYERNFSPGERGRRVGRGLTLKVAVSGVSGLLLGAWFERRSDHWWMLILIGAAATGALSVLNRQFPSEPLAALDDGRRRPWPHFDLLGKDSTLRLILGTWMLMGFGNLMLLPLRVEYLAQPEYGIESSAAAITLFTVAVPSFTRLLVTPLFGRVFDVMPFFSLRIVLNLFFVVSTVAFFGTANPLGLWIGAACLGVAFAGGDLMWMLWVTEFAPSDRVADYMGLHTFFTGVRAVSAPLVGFVVVEHFPLRWVAFGGAAAMFGAGLLLVPRAWAEFGRRPLGETVASRL